MDYTNDACRRMFTVGQSDRMSATLYEVRNSLLGSQGAIPPPASATADLWMKDTDADVGDEPNNNSTHFYISDDIWVRNSNDGLTNQESQNPIGGQTNFVYVRVRNKGCNPASNATLKLYWAKASSSLSWPTPWDGSITSPALMGDPIGTQNITSINGNDFQIFTFNWTGTPLPSDYAVFGADKAHFCLLARIETDAAAPFGMTFPETNSLGQNVKNNNNIAWKNISISETEGSGFAEASVVITNYTRESSFANIEFNFLTNQHNNINIDADEILEAGKFEVTINIELLGLIKELNFDNVDGLEHIGGMLFRITKPIARINKIRLDPKKFHVVEVKFTPNEERSRKRKLINLNVLQIDLENNNQIYGGENFKFLI